jgi:plastocyanin
MKSFSFVPATLTISAGTTVTWTNNDPVNHTVTADNGSFDSGVVLPGDSFSFTFNTPGNYLYYCSIHGGPGGVGMSGMIIVTP